MNIFKRIFRIGQAEIHAAVEKMEDPVKMTEQGLRELKEDLNEATEAYARVKALAIRTRNEQEVCLKEAATYGEKAVLVMEKAQNGSLELEKAEALAKEALRLKMQHTQESEDLERQAAVHQQSAAEMLNNIAIIKENLSKWEKELKTLKARVKVSKATQQVNKQLAHLDANNTISMLERMKEKAEDQEALAKAYGEIAGEKSTIKDDLEKVLNDKTGTIESDLEAIKKQLGMDKG
ncbi:MAG: PspA/IM30 family protein [Sphingobacteriales bacterium]|nr:MAG: PspA/IM30 family protein [Sphingobacteriales bacterium]